MKEYDELTLLQFSGYAPTPFPPIPEERRTRYTNRMVRLGLRFQLRHLRTLNRLFTN